LIFLHRLIIIWLAMALSIPDSVRDFLLQVIENEGFICRPTTSAAAIPDSAPIPRPTPRMRMNRLHFQEVWDGQASAAEATALLSPRKRPRQGRSIALVLALKAACRQILLKEGAAQLSAAHLAEVSGVSTGSIYEYFPKLESLVAEVLRETIQEAAGEPSSVLALPQDTPLLEVLGLLVRRTLAMRACLIGLHRDVYLRHMQHFEAIDVDTMQQLLARFSDRITLQDKRLAALVVANALGQFSQIMLHENPLYMRSPDVERMMVRMLHAALIDTGHTPASLGEQPGS
jgi:AcrR family transcriptional regulator